MGFARLSGIFVLLLYLKNVNGQGIANNNMGFNGITGYHQQNVPNMNNYNHLPMNPSMNTNIPPHNLSPQVNTPLNNNFQTLKQVNFQPPNKPAISTQQPPNMQQNNLETPNSPQAAKLQMPRQASHIQANEVNLGSPRSSGYPSQGPVPLQITSFNFIPVDQMPYGLQNQVPFIPNAPTNTFSAQIPPSLQIAPNLVAQIPQQNQPNLYQNSIPFLPFQDQFITLGNQQFLAQPSMDPNQPFLSFPNQPAFNAMGAPVITIQPQPYMPNQSIIPVQSQPIPNSLSVTNQQPGQVPPVVAYQGQPASNSYQGSATYIPFSPQYAPAIPLFTSIPSYSTPAPKSKSSGLKAILPYLINLLQERQRSLCPNCGCTSSDQEPQIFGGYSNQKNYGTLPNEQSLPIVSIDSNDIQTNSRFLREHKNPKKNIVNTESEEFSEEDSAEADDAEDSKSDAE